MNKVYCTNCKFFGQHNTDLGKAVWCDHPTNVYTAHRFDGPVKQRREDPKDMNKFADCKLYEAKPPGKLKHLINTWCS